MGVVPKVKCNFYNTVFCKYNKYKGCKYDYPEEKCVDINCEIHDCPKRHQKCCKIFEKTKCEYLHNTSVGVHDSEETKRSENNLNTL